MLLVLRVTKRYSKERSILSMQKKDAATQAASFLLY